MDSNTIKLCHRLNKANNKKFNAKIRICNGISRWIEMGWAGLKTVGLEKVWRDKGFYLVVASSLEYGGVEGKKKMILKVPPFLRWSMLLGCPFFFDFDLIFTILFANEHKLVQVSSVGIWRSKSPYFLGSLTFQKCLLFAFFVKKYRLILIHSKPMKIVLFLYWC